MNRRNLGSASVELDGIELISTDVFDTLLLRNGKSQRARLVEAENRFARVLAESGFAIPPDVLLETRIRAERLAFRALNLSSASDEVQAEDIIRRQLQLLGAPSRFVRDRLAIELEIEKRCLHLNASHVSLLRNYRQAGIPVVAISDTTLPAASLKALISHFCGTEHGMKIYSSASERKTKRNGDLFSSVAAENGVPLSAMLHFGDDEIADHRVPAKMGIKTVHLPRPATVRLKSRATGGLTEAARQVRKSIRYAPLSRTTSRDQVTFARDVLGPIVAQFSLLIWLYALQAGAKEKAVLLFCSRGGIGIREAFESVLLRLKLELQVSRENLMISRLVAARAAVLAKSPTALQELSREFRGSTFSDVAHSLGGASYPSTAEWEQPFEANQFFNLLMSSSGAQLLSDIKQQNDFFAEYFAKLRGGAERIILCDTGLYGSTQRLLTAGFPHLKIETVQFARANYKGHSEEHFPNVVGLLVERNQYDAIHIESCVLRYWQLIESLFEPDVPSVRTFRRDEAGQIVANSGPIGFGELDPARGNPLLTGVLQYIDALPEGDGGASIMHDADFAWRRLKRAITRPTDADVHCLDVGIRSVDFGRSGTVRIFAEGDKGFVARLASLKKQLWREGKIARDFPVLSPLLFTMVESAHAVRGLARLR